MDKEIVKFNINSKLTYSLSIEIKCVCQIIKILLTFAVKAQQA